MRVSFVCLLLLLAAQCAFAQVNESVAEQALEQSYAIRKELALLNIPHRYVDDLIYDSEKAFQGQNVTLLSAKIASMKDANESAQFIAALNTTFTPEEIAMLRANASKIRYDYGKVVQDLGLIEARRDLAYGVLDRIVVLEQQLSSPEAQGFDMSEVNGLLSVSKQKFKDEQLDEIPPLLDRAERRFEEIQIEASRMGAILDASRRGLAGYLKEYWPQMIGILVLISLLGSVAWNEMSILRLRSGLSRLAVEMKVVGELALKAQRSYYQDKEISKSVYEIKADKYGERKLQIKERIPILKEDLRKSLSRRRYYMPWKARSD